MVEIRNNEAGDIHHVLSRLFERHRDHNGDYRHSSQLWPDYRTRATRHIYSVTVERLSMSPQERGRVMTKLEFKHQFSQNTLLVQATIIDEGRPGRAPDLNQPGDPEEAPEVELRVWLIDKPDSVTLDDENTPLRLDIEDIWTKIGTRFEPLTEILEQSALEIHADNKFWRNCKIP